jgi:hypothetical protein
MGLDMYRVKEALRGLRTGDGVSPRKAILLALAIVLFAVAGYLIFLRDTSPPPLTKEEQAAVRAVEASMPPSEAEAYQIPVREPGSGRVPTAPPPR